MMPGLRRRRRGRKTCDLAKWTLTVPKTFFSTFSFKWQGVFDEFVYEDVNFFLSYIWIFAEFCFPKWYCAREKFCNRCVRRVCWLSIDLMNKNYFVTAEKQLHILIELFFISTFMLIRWSFISAFSCAFPQVSLWRRRSVRVDQHFFLPSIELPENSWSFASIMSRMLTRGAKRRPFDRLSDEVVLNIFSFIVHDDFRSLRLTCRRFNELSKEPELWKKVSSWNFKVIIKKCFPN